jgi:phosphatidylinositol alpha-mannosyltransferase
MKVGIVVPFSWSFWGAVVEHAELQAEALRRLGIETRTIMGNDPPGQFTRALHPREGRDGPPPPDVIPVGRSAIVPANGSLPNIILGPRSVWRIKQALEREQFDLIHLHEPLTPTLCIASLAMAKCPVVATFPDRRPYRRVRAGAGLGEPVLGRGLRGDPERRADPARGRPGRP